MNIKYLSETALLIIFATTVTTPLMTNRAEAQTPNCTYISDPNPPTNVRSTPKVESGNIVAQLASNTLVTVVNSRNEWVQINAPVRGWVNTSLTRNCDQPNNPEQFNQKFKWINNLGTQATKGDRAAADKLIALMSQVDGHSVELLTEVMAEWGVANPAFLISVLDKKTPEIRTDALRLLSFGFSTQQRQRFESVIRKFPNSPTVKAWQSGVYQSN